MVVQLIKHEPQQTSEIDTPIVFIHGMWHGAWYWDDFIPFFTAKGFTCYSFNLRKHGGERKPKGIRWVRIKHYVDDLIDVIGQLDTPQY
ncbi:MAG: alpha/beta hydrolase [Candidatus Kariarchaeaceae archaeon]|jgi:pimeloyl-ACP methyl ester carboxylesterase